VSEPAGVVRDNLDFFNALSATLRVDLSEPTEKISEHLMNQRATPKAEIVSVSLQPQVFVRDEGKFRDLTAAELELVVLEVPSVTLRGYGRPIEHQAPDGRRFTVADLVTAVAETERQTRAESEWFEGVDVHHVFFEGMAWDGEAWKLRWGS
jgi:hypothetical protein